MGKAPIYTCPQCQGGFDLRDGYPGGEIKLCSPSCQEQWLMAHNPRDWIPDESLPQMADSASSGQMNARRVSPIQQGDPGRMENPWKQME